MKQNKAFLGFTKFIFDTVIYTVLYDLKAVHGAEKLPGEGAAVVATNHSYWVDPFTAGYLLFSRYPERPFSLPGKDSLFQKLISRAAMEMWGAYPADRTGNASSMNRRLYEAFKTCMEQKFPFIYCPEGTRDPEHITAIYAGFIRRAWIKNREIPLFVESHKYEKGKKTLRRQLEVFIDGPYYPTDLGLESLVDCNQRIADFVGNLFAERTGLPYVPKYKTKITEMRAAGRAYSAKA